MIPERFTRGLVGAWLCNEGAGSSLRDQSPYQHHGTHIGGVSWGNSVRGSVLDCDGVDSQVAMGPSTNLEVGTSGITCACWVLTDTTQTAKTIFASWFGEFTWMLWRGTGTEEIIFEVRKDATTQQARIGQVIPLNTWVHVMGVWRPDDKVQLFKSGRFIDDSAAAVAPPLDNPGSAVDIGRSNVGNFKMLCRDFYLWNRGMSVEEVHHFYLTQVTPQAP